MLANQPQNLRNDWSRDEILGLFDLPFNDLLFQAQIVIGRTSILMKFS